MNSQVYILTETHLTSMFCCAAELQVSLPKTRFFDLNELALDGIKWVDDVSGLRDATCHIEGCKVIGIDCEWKPVYEKGKKPKVHHILIKCQYIIVLATIYLLILDLFIIFHTFIFITS